ncbi:hypothetical protein [Methylobacterium iners]|uniref:hypothetical protein n=1 Tax=Methylobacterium iners TaxID=418707 RepID=UPI001EE3930D|nr:hypothetical protein [Methylobacterium iners]
MDFEHSGGLPGRGLLAPGWRVLALEAAALDLPLDPHRGIDHLAPVGLRDQGGDGRQLVEGEAQPVGDGGPGRDLALARDGAQRSNRRVDLLSTILPGLVVALL